MVDKTQTFTAQEVQPRWVSEFHHDFRGENHLPKGFPPFFKIVVDFQGKEREFPQPSEIYCTTMASCGFGFRVLHPFRLFPQKITNVLKK